jgi:DNA-binding IclR family transcriptional regulator
VASPWWTPAACSASGAAHQVGGSRQQVNRILAALDEAGAIERLGHRITAIRPHLLAVDE